jgi:hypothetical protein
VHARIVLDGAAEVKPLTGDAIDISERLHKADADLLNAKNIPAKQGDR